MSKPIFWKNVSILVQTAISAAVAIKSISAAAEGVVAFDVAAPAVAPTDLKVGAWVLLRTVGASGLDQRVIRVKTYDEQAKTFVLDGEDTTLEDDFISGTFEVVHFGAGFRSTQTVAPSGGEVEWGDTSLIHKGLKTEGPGAVSAMTLSLTNLFQTDDPGYLECHKSFKAAETRAILLGFGKQAKMAFNCYAGAPGIPLGNAAVQHTVTLKAQGMPTLYAT